MQAELKDYHSPDIQDLEHYWPDIEDNFCFLLQLFIGPKGNQGQESFDLVVCTPKWLEAKVREEGPLFSRHYLIVAEYNFQDILKKVEQYVNTQFADNWNGLADRLSRIGHWEFEDYRP